MNTTISLVIGLLLIMGIGGFVYSQKIEKDSQFATPTPTQTETPADNGGMGAEMDDDDEKGKEDDDDDIPSENTPAPSGGTGGITMTDVAVHNSRSSCWSAINGSVYDLTSWIPNHPGGEQAIIGLCGTDGSAKFNGQHGGSQRQLTVLAGFKIGVLSQ